MLNRKVKNIASFILALCLCLALAMPALAADTAEFMPSEIIGALNGINTLSGENGTTNDVIITEIAKPTSLGIDDVVNIDIDKIHQTYPLSEMQQQLLKEHGYSEEEIAQMDMGDFFNLESTWTIAPSDISLIKYLYPELADVDMSNWTYGDWHAYYVADNENLYVPSAEEKQALIDRNITLDDAKKLLSDYYTYENILAQTDEQLADDISKYYQFTVDNIYNMLQYEKNVDENIARISPAENPNPNFYVAVDFPGYKKDWFHKNSGSNTESFRLEQKAATQAAYNCIYNTTSKFIATNMYGTWSESQSGAHEGIDFNEPAIQSDTCDIYSIAEGTVLVSKKTETVGQLSVYVGTTSAGHSVNKTFTYYHMSSVAVPKDSSVKTGDKVGKQGKTGLNSTGYHVHFEVNAGSFTGLRVEKNDDNLDSLSPYQLRPFLTY